METRLVLVALVTLALGCGETQGVTGDAGSDAEAVDLGGLDVAVDDGGEGDGGADAGDPQCAGMADLSPCDDGRAFTVDACIGGVCVGRSCSDNQVPRNCNTARLTLTSCEGVPFENGTACDDGDAFTTSTTCTGGVCGGGDPCPCPPGEPCCVGATCAFAAAGTSCNEWVEVDCDPGDRCGGAYQQIVHDVQCTGDSPACDGPDVTSLGEHNDCAGDRFCTDGSFVEPNDDGRDVTFGCVPSC